MAKRKRTVKVGAGELAPSSIPSAESTVLAAPQRKKDPRDLRDMDRTQLEVVARKYRVRECDVVNLNDDRLRQNIMAKLEETFA